MSTVDKVCPVVFRDASMQQILAFEHPKAGVQLVKGGIEPGESVRAAALRELAEESGIAETGIAEDWAPGNPAIAVTYGRSNFAHFRADCPKPGRTIAPTTAATTSNSSGTT